MRNPLIIKTVIFSLVVFSGVFINCNCSDSGGGEFAMISNKYGGSYVT